MIKLSDSSIKIARWLGYGGLIPFVAGVAVLGIGRIGLRELALNGVLTYGAIILSFMGAVHWGRAMFASDESTSAEDTTSAFVISVIPALIGWFAGFLEPRPALIVLAGAFAALYWYDRRVFAGDSNNAWYLPLRLRLTIVVIICLLLSAALL